MQAYSIKYTRKFKTATQVYVYETTSLIDASTRSFAIKKLRRKVKGPFKVIEVSIVGYY